MSFARRFHALIALLGFGPPVPPAPALPTADEILGHALPFRPKAARRNWTGGTRSRHPGQGTELAVPSMRCNRCRRMGPQHEGVVVVYKLPRPRQGPFGPHFRAGRMEIVCARRATSGLPSVLRG